MSVEDFSLILLQMKLLETELNNANVAVSVDTHRGVSCTAASSACLHDLPTASGQAPDEGMLAS